MHDILYTCGTWLNKQKWLPPCAFFTVAFLFVSSTGFDGWGSSKDKTKDK